MHESETLDQCPTCGRYTSADEGYCAPYPPNYTLDDGADSRAYCTLRCFERLLIRCFERLLSSDLRTLSPLPKQTP